jgi:tetratricopeptide (TPR) repeat protein
MRGIVAILLALFVLAPAAPARADELTPAERGARAKARFEEGQAHFKQGEYEAAALEFEAAYEYHPLPILLWNIGQSYRKAGSLSKAIEFYRAYLKADPNTKKKAEVAQYIVDMEAQLARTQSAPSRPETIATTTTTTEPRPTTATTTTTTPERNPPVEPDRDENPPMQSRTPPPALGTAKPPGAPVWYKDVLGGVLVSVGFVAMVTGAALLGDAGVTLSNANNSYDQFKAAQGVKPELGAGAALLSVGAAVAVGGVVRYLIVHKRSQTASATIAPAHGGGALLVVGGTF